MISTVIKSTSFEEVNYRGSFFENQIIIKETNKLINKSRLLRFDESSFEALNAPVTSCIALENTGDSGLQGHNKTTSDGFDQFSNTTKWNDLSPEFKAFIRVCIFSTFAGGLQALVLGLARGDDYSTIIVSTVRQGIASGILSSAMNCLIGGISKIFSSLKFFLNS